MAQFCVSASLLLLQPGLCVCKKKNRNFAFVLSTSQEFRPAGLWPSHITICKDTHPSFRSSHTQPTEKEEGGVKKVLCV